VSATNRTSGKFQKYASVLKGRRRLLDLSLWIARTETARRSKTMPKLLPDQSFYPSPTMAMQAPAETLAYVALLNPDPTANDALAVLDVDPASPGYGAQIARVDMPRAGDELHHFGWNACSSCLCPNSPHPHMQRRYLVVPGMRSSRIHILDTAPDPRQPRLVKVIEAEDIIRKTGYSRPHTAHRALRARWHLRQRAGQR
jgi:selenium-binding protein 1